MDVSGRSARHSEPKYTHRQALKAHVPDNEEKHTGGHEPMEVRVSGMSMQEASMSLNLELKKKKKEATCKGHPLWEHWLSKCHTYIHTMNIQLWKETKT